MTNLTEQLLGHECGALGCQQLRNKALAKIEALSVALEPFANVAEQIRKAATDERWLEQVLFYMGDDDDPSKWSLTGRAFDKARTAISETQVNSMDTDILGEGEEYGISPPPRASQRPSS